MNWQNKAVCRDEDTSLFFPPSNEGPGYTQGQEAKSFCARCPVQPDCRAWALSEEGPEYGVLGGLTEQERAVLKRRNPAPTRKAA